MINSATFAGQTPTQQTGALAKAEGRSVLFVPSFVYLSDKKRIRDNLLAGKDVSLELEFNEIELSEEDKLTLKAVMPVLEKINGVSPVYPWLPEEEFASIRFTDKRITRNSHDQGVASAKKIWEKASRYWSGGPKPAIHSRDSTWNSKQVAYNENGISIGCQAISRAEVEYIARNYGWAPNVFEG